MADIGIGALGYIGLAPEASEGIAVAPTNFIAANSISWDDTNDYQTPLQIKLNRDSELALTSPFNVTGNVEMMAVPHDIGLLLKSAFAASVSTSAYAGTSGYTHVLTPGNTSPTMTFETSYTGAAGDETLIMRHTGIRVNTFEMRATFGEAVMWTFGLDGVGREKRASGVAEPLYDAQSIYPFHFTGATISIAGSPSVLVKEYTFNVNNNVEHIGTIRGTRAYRRVALGTREMGLSMSLDFADGTEYQRFLDEDEFAVSLYMENGQDLTGGAGKKVSFKIDLPRVRYRAVGLPLNAGDFLTQDVECTILKPNGAAIATVTLVNNENGAGLVA